MRPFDSFFKWVQTCMRVALNQTKKGFSAFVGAIDEFRGMPVDLLVNGRHAAARQGPGINDLLLAYSAPFGVDCLVVDIRGRAVQHPARAIVLFELRVLRVVIPFRLLLGVQVVEVAEKLVEAVHRRQMLVVIAQVVLAELAGGVALLLEQIGDRGRPVGNAMRRAGHADRQQSRPERVLPQNERGPPRRAALLRVKVGEHRPFLGHPVDVRRPVSHDSMIIRADIMNADVIAPDNQDVGLLALGSRLTSGRGRFLESGRCEQLIPQEPVRAFKRRVSACGSGSLLERR